MEVPDGWLAEKFYFRIVWGKFIKFMKYPRHRVVWETLIHGILAWQLTQYFHTWNIHNVSSLTFEQTFNQAFRDKTNSKQFNTEWQVERFCWKKSGKVQRALFNYSTIIAVEKMPCVTLRNARKHTPTQRFQINSFHWVIYFSLYTRFDRSDPVYWNYKPTPIKDGIGDTTERNKINAIKLN